MTLKGVMAVILRYLIESVATSKWLKLCTRLQQKCIVKESSLRHCNMIHGYVRRAYRVKVRLGHTATLRGHLSDS